MSIYMQIVSLLEHHITCNHCSDSAGPKGGPEGHVPPPPPQETKSALKNDKKKTFFMR